MQRHVHRVNNNDVAYSMMLHTALRIKKMVHINNIALF